MSGKERILAALRCEEVDRVPCVPLVVAYSAGAFADDMPHYIPDIMRAAGLDIWTQYAADYKRSVVPLPDSGITLIRRFVDGDLLLGYETPVGTITERYRSGAFNSLNPHVEYLLKTPEDLKVFYYVREHSVPRLIDLREHYRWEKRQIGDDGICVSVISQEMSPFKNFIELIAGVENTYYLMQDEPDLFDATMELMHEQNKELIRQAAARSEAEVFLQSENVSTTTESPTMYQDYLLDPLNDYADIIHDTGKLHVVHMCGKLKLLEKELLAGRYDAIGDISPSPTGDTELWEAAEMWPNKAVKGGLECHDFIAEDPETCYRKAMMILERTRGRNGVLLGSGDSVPYGTTIEHLNAIRRAADDFAGGV